MDKVVKYRVKGSQWGGLKTGQAQKIMISTWRPVSESVIKEGWIVGTVHFNIFVNDLDFGVEYILSKLVDDTKPEVINVL